MKFSDLRPFDLDELAAFIERAQNCDDKDLAVHAITAKLHQIGSRYCYGGKKHGWIRMPNPTTDPKPV